MMRSLWSGVSGLRVHQVGMDVEGNNIANVNTYGFKYSRVNYSTMFAQTMAIATQPTDTTGGKNAKQVGLGVMAAATQRIHSQGSISGTDSNYDVAIEGNGFFLVSNDGGKTRYLTRDGAFNQDAAGNFVNSNGFIVQGWVRDPVTGRIDTALSPGNLSWDPAMNLPANPSSSIFLNAQLNSGRKITQETSRYIYSLDALHGGRINGGGRYSPDGTITEDSSQNNQFYTTSKNALDITEKSIDFASVYSGSTYENLNLRSGQSFWFSYKNAEYTTQNNATAFSDAITTADQNGVIFWGDNIQRASLDITLNGVHIQGQVAGLDAAISLINEYTAKQNAAESTGIRAKKAANGKSIEFINENTNGTTDNMKNINLVVNTGNTAGEFWSIAAVPAGQTTRTQAQYDIVVAQHQGGATKGTPNLQGSAWISSQNNAAGVANAAAFNKQIITAHRYEYSSEALTIPQMSDPVSGFGFVQADIDTANSASHNYAAALLGDLLNTQPRRFHSTEDLRELMQRDARYGVDYSGNGTELRGTERYANENINHNVTLSVDTTGRYVFTNPANSRTIGPINYTNGQAYGSLPALGGAVTVQTNSTAKNMLFQATSYSSEAAQVSANDALTNLFKTFVGNLDTGNKIKTSTSMVLSSFSTSLEMYDSLGTKHLLRVEWSKHETTLDGGNEWQMILRLDEPATFNHTGTGKNNIIIGSVRFGNDGSLTSFDPTEITFSGNNGSAPNQLVRLNLGANGGFNGLVSNEQTSALSQQQTDGYAPGVLKQGMQNMSIDQNGVIVGTFTNGITMPMGKIAMGNVVNEAGLQDMGNNLWAVSNNSGTLTIGAPNVGGRGAFKSGALELSNADLSLSLTNLIVIQRGYQANSKTITTSDTMLNTLLQLKQ